jgi:preprotein translocase subunit YajC
MDFLISTAHAAETGTQTDSFMSLVPLVLIFVFFYFLIIRPQGKRQKEHKQMVSALEKGDEILTNGGVVGKLTEVGEQFVTAEIASGVEVKIQRHAVSAVLPKGTVKNA